MDKLEKRLKADAERIHAEISPDLEKRIDAAIESARQVRSVPTRPRQPATFWWASSLTGLAAAILLIAVLNWNRNGVETVPVEPVATSTVPGSFTELGVAIPLEVTPAYLTDPLADELEKLQDDIERARRNVEEDLRSTF